MNSSSPVPAALMQPQTMTLPSPCLTVDKTLLSLYSSSGCCQTRLTPSEPNTFILVSSDQISQTVGRAPLVGNRDVTGGARQTGGNFPFYALYGNVRSKLPESGARPRTRLESDCAVCVCSTRHLSFIFVFMVTNEMFNFLSGIRFGPIYGIFISVLLRVRSQIWDLECSVT